RREARSLKPGCSARTDHSRGGRRRAMLASSRSPTATMLHFLSSDIGRGHPYYLDGVREELHAMGASHAIDADASVFEVAAEPSHTAWRAARRAYLLAGHGGVL